MPQDTTPTDDPKVMHVMAGAAEGGAENIFLECVLALDDAGVAQHVVTRNNNSFRLEKFKERGIPVTIAGFNRYWPFPTRSAISSAVASFQPDIAEYWMGRAGTFAYSGANAPVNVGWYGGYYKLSRFAHCSYHVALTEDIRRHIIAQGADESETALIHTYAEFEPQPPTPKASLETPEDAPVLLCLARLHWKKGLDLALKALVDIEGAYLWIAGDGPLESELKEMASELGVADRTRFLGWRNDRGALLAAADVCVFPSRYEPFGTVTVDAWAAGTPLVAAASQGPAAYVKDEDNGMLVPMDDVDALRTAIVHVLKEPELRDKIVAGGRETYEHQFTKQAYIRDSLDFYRKIAAR